MASTTNVKIIMIETTEMMGVAVEEGPEEEEDRAEIAQIEEVTDAETGTTTGPPEEEEVGLTLQTMEMMMTMVMMKIQVRKTVRLKMIMKIVGTWKQTRS